MKDSPEPAFEDKSFEELKKLMSEHLAKKDGLSALKVANQAALKYGAAGLYLVYQANNWLRLNPGEEEGLSDKELDNMLVLMSLGKQCCESQLKERQLFQYYFPELSLDIWDAHINQLCKDEKLDDIKQAAIIKAKDALKLFLDDTPLTSKQKRDILLDELLPARRRELSSNLQEFLKLSTKATAQKFPDLVINKQHVSSEHGYVEAAFIQCNPEPKKAIIHCRGNNELYQEVQSDLIMQANDIHALVVGFNYPSVLNSEKVEINTQIIVDSIKSLIEQVHTRYNIPYRDITIQGHSLGAALGSIAALQCHNAQQPVRLINGRSFASLTALANQKEGFMAEQHENLQDNPDLMIEAAEAYLQIPQEYKLLITAEDDPVIPYSASVLHIQCIRNQNEAERLRQKNLYHVRYPQQNAHNCNLGDLINNDGRPANEIVNAFVQKDLPNSSMTSKLIADPL